MRALVLDEVGIHLGQVDDPALKPGEALIKVRMAGVCRTDLELAKGYLNFRGVPGHEFDGEVAQMAPPVNSAADLIGKRVIGEINCGGGCELCRAAGNQRNHRAGMALRLLQQRLIPTEQLITAVYPAQELEAAFGHAQKHEALKVPVNFR